MKPDPFDLLADHHTYFVGDDDWGFSVWVHNANYSSRSRHPVYQHGHAANSAKQPGKSRFRVSEGGQKFTDEVVNHPSVIVTPQTNGRIRYDVADLGRAVGRDLNGNLTRGGRVIVEGPTPFAWSTYSPGEVVTQFPL